MRHLDYTWFDGHSDQKTQPMGPVGDKIKYWQGKFQISPFIIESDMEWRFETIFVMLQVESFYCLILFRYPWILDAGTKQKSVPSILPFGRWCESQQNSFRSSD